ncbi:MAG: hypothetical protein DRN04_00625 [Thermoprotei archaeon]|nr:MAG: hypothetical protein DRN04_00625 [Thermoprotei archaeon]
MGEKSMTIPTDENKNKRDIDKLQLIKCIYNLNDLDIKVYKALTELRGATVKELAEKLNYSRSSIQKSLYKLISHKLVERKKILGKRNYKYLYYPLPFTISPEIKKAAKEILGIEL